MGASMLFLKYFFFVLGGVDSVNATAISKSRPTERRALGMIFDHAVGMTTRKGFECTMIEVMSQEVIQSKLKVMTNAVDLSPQVLS
jgi:hypothetical protein